MTKPLKLDKQAIDAALEALPGWERDKKCITRTFTFADFSEAFGFMTRAALLAERMDHHPDWHNVWNKVEVRLTTHDSGGVTGKDVELASGMDRIAGA